MLQIQLYVVQVCRTGVIGTLEYVVKGRGIDVIDALLEILVYVVKDRGIGVIDTFFGNTRLCGER